MRVTMGKPIDLTEWLDDPWERGLKAIAELEQIEQDLQQRVPTGKAMVAPRAKVVAYPIEEKTLCWSCQRATWQCLCQWPKVPIPGIKTEQLEPYDYEWPLLRVIFCPHFWPEMVHCEAI